MSSNNVDGFFLDRFRQASLRDELAGVPALAQDLAVTLTRQDHVSNGLGGGRRPKRLGSRLPLNLAAASASTDLHNVLATWVRLTCESRGLTPDCSNDLVSMAKWLRVNIVALAMTEGSAESYEDIAGSILACRKVIDLPVVRIDADRLKAANRSVVTLSTIDTVVEPIGDLAEGLNRERLRTLIKAGLRAASTDPETRTKFYRLGDVLDAHYRHERREGA